MFFSVLDRRPSSTERRHPSPSANEGRQGTEIWYRHSCRDRDGLRRAPVLGTRHADAVRAWALGLARVSRTRGRPRNKDRKTWVFRTQGTEVLFPAQGGSFCSMSRHVPRPGSLLCRQCSPDECSAVARLAQVTACSGAMGLIRARGLGQVSCGTLHSLRKCPIVLSFPCGDKHLQQAGRRRGALWAM